MSVELNPADLGFRRPFTQEVTQSLHLHNPGLDPVAFKVKTTAPKQYCVRPNSGRIEPGKEVVVHVILQAMREDPPLETKCRDKFLVQSVAITADRDIPNLTALWQYVDQNAKSAIQEKKIRVTWLPADGQGMSTPMHNNINGTTFKDTPNTPAFRSPSPESVTPSHAAPVGPVSVPASRPENNKHLGDAVSSAFNPASNAKSNKDQSEASTGTVSAITNTISHSIPTSTDELKAQLAEAKATIAKLTQQAQDQVLRQRKTGGGSGAEDSNERGTTSLATQLQPTEGVPVQVVAGLCLLSFLLAYLLF